MRAGFPNKAIRACIRHRACVWLYNRPLIMSLNVYAFYMPKGDGAIPSHSLGSRHYALCIEVRVQAYRDKRSLNLLTQS